MYEIFDMLVVEVGEQAGPFTEEYYHEMDTVEQHLQWPSDQLDAEGKEHLEQAWDAEFHAVILERKALHSNLDCRRNSLCPSVRNKNAPASPVRDKGVNLCGTTPVPRKKAQHSRAL